MATYTNDYNLYKPDNTDDFGDFRTEFNNNMDIIDANLGGGGGGGGHTIENASGTALTQRSDLQFAGYLVTTDDSVNDRTVVDDTPTEVTWATWQTMTAPQKAGKKFVITNVPSGIDPNENILLNQALSFVGNVATISNGSVTADTLVEVYFKDSSLTEATSCKVVCDTGSGVITFTSTSNPLNTLYCDIVIRN